MSEPAFPTSGPEATRLYLAEGFQPIPVTGRTKTITRPEWEKERVAPGDDLSRFAGVNTGLLLGCPSGGLTVVDLDTPEAVVAAPYLLPKTGRVSGRKSNRHSHWWYRRPGAADGTEQFSEQPPAPGKGGKVLVELRASGMTLVPPSLNPNDGGTPEAVIWHESGEPATVPADDLRRAVAYVAGAALLARHWPAEGRHFAALRVSGALLRSPGWDPDRVKTLLEAVCAAAGDDELANRLACVDATHDCLADPNARVTGWPKLAEFFGEPVAARLRDWLAPPPRITNGKGRPEANGRYGGRGAPVSPPTPHVPLPPYRPFPVDVMPGPWAAFCEEGGRVLKCDTAAVALPAMSVLAGAVGMTRRVYLGGEWTEPAVFWTCTVQESGTRKSGAAELSTKLVLARQKRLLAQYRAALEAHKQEAADRKRERREAGGKRRGGGDDEDDPPPPKLARVVVSDITTEKLSGLLDDNPRGLLLYRDELAGWLGSFCRYKGKTGGSDEPNWLSIHRADAVVYDRKTGDKTTVFVPHAAVSVTGTIQPGKLRRLLGPELVDSGFAARVLFDMPPRTPRRTSRTPSRPTSRRPPNGPWTGCTTWPRRRTRTGCRCW